MNVKYVGGWKDRQALHASSKYSLAQFTVVILESFPVESKFISKASRRFLFHAFHAAYFRAASLTR